METGDAYKTAQHLESCELYFFFLIPDELSRKTWQSLQARPTAAAGAVAIGTFSLHVQAPVMFDASWEEPGPTTPTNSCFHEPLIRMCFSGLTIIKNQLDVLID